MTINILELLLPAACSGLLLGGFLLYLNLSINYKSRLYTAITLLGLTAFLFVLSETIISFWGVWLKHAALGRQFHRIEQLVGAYFLFTLPYLIVHLLELNRLWQRINFVIAITGLGIAVILTIIAFAQPDLYISMVKPPLQGLILTTENIRG